MAPRMSVFMRSVVNRTSTRWRRFGGSGYEVPGSVHKLFLISCRNLVSHRPDGGVLWCNSLRGRMKAGCDAVVAPLKYAARYAWIFFGRDD